MAKISLPLPTRRRVDNRAARALKRADTEAAKSGVRVLNASSDTAELMIYGYIGDDYFGVSANSVIEQLSTITAPKLVIRINSAGGDIFEAAAIYNAIRRHPGEKTSAIDGLAASAASWLALAADRVTIGVGAYVMIHNAYAVTYGDAGDLRKQADDLDKMTANIAAIYATKTGTSAAEWLALMDAETWFTQAEAIDAGLADGESDPLPAIAAGDEAAPLMPANKFDLSRFGNVPDQLRATNVRGPRDVEKTLREAGISRTAAKAAVSNLRDEAQRDAGADFWRGLRDLASTGQ